MKLNLRLLALSLLACTAIGSMAQAPQSGTYKIKSAVGGGKSYVRITSKYYAKPNASATEASEIGVGIGYKNDGGYRVFSLSGKNPNDGSTIEVYDYVDKAYNIVSSFAQGEISKKLATKLGSLIQSEDERQQILSAINAMADSICKIYTDDYAYMTLIPEAHYGNKWLVRAKATVPAIPYTVQAVGNYIVTGAEVNKGHKCTDVWDWAKQHVLKYLDVHQTDSRLKQMVQKYLDQVTPGTTYYLVYDKDDQSFGYSTDAKADNGLWTMEEVSTTADGLQPGVKNIKNNSTGYYVNVTGKYDAEPNLTLGDIQGSDVNKKNAAITLDFGRFSRTNDKLYRITELSNQGQDIVGYLSKGMDKTFEVLDKKLKEKNVYEFVADFANNKLKSKNITDTITAENVRADVKTAVDLCADHYAYMKLIDNGDGSVSLRVDMPQVPALLDLAVQMLKGQTFEDFAKNQISQYFASSQTTESLKNLWNQNKDKWHFGHNYYLSAEFSYKTFEFTEDASDAAAKWTLAEVNTTSNTYPYQGYFRIKNVGGYNDQQYIDVRGRITADASATNDSKLTKPGTILYVNMDANGKAISSPYAAGQTVKAYELLNLRSQGIDVMNGCEATAEELASIFNPSSSGLLNSAYNGYIGFGRYMLTLGAGFADQHIRGYVPGTDNQSKFDALMKDFNDNYLPNLKFQVYLIPVDGKKDTYLVRSMVPSLKPIVDFYKSNKTEMDAIVVPAVREFLNNHSGLTGMIRFSGEKFTEDDDKTINSWYSTDGGEWHVKNCCEKNPDGSLKGSGTDTDPWTLSYSTILGSEQIMFDWLKLQMLKALEATGRDNTIGGYVNMIHYNTPYYLIEGDNHDAQGNRGYTGNAELGFANDGLNAGTAPSGSGSIADDLSSAKDHAYWTLEPVDETNYFTVKPNSHAGKNGKYYSSTYLDFPFEVKGSNVSAVYIVDSETGVKPKDGNQYVCFNKVSGNIIPAATPAIIEFNASTVDNTLALQPVVSDARAEKDQLVQGTFLGGRHRVENSEGGILSQLKNTNLGDKWGVDTNEKDLYLFGYNKKDNKNPYGFYLYSAWSTANDKQTVIPANKPFLILSENASGAKVYVLFGDGTTTALDNVFSDDAQIPADAPRYNVAGQRVDKDYKGVVIVKGKKYIQK